VIEMAGVPPPPDGGDDGGDVTVALSLVAPHAVSAIAPLFVSPLYESRQK
jgi:hypothetical protein